MKKTNRSQIVFITLLVPLVALTVTIPLTTLTGCAWSRAHPDRAELSAQQIATMVTREVLLEDPTLAPQFERARVELAVIATAEVISVSSVIGIINRLPAEKLQTRSARIATDGLVLTIAFTGDPALPAQTTSDLRPIVRGLEAGIRAGKSQAGL